MSEHPSYWARVQAPTPDAKARLILMAIADNPAGDEHHGIHIKKTMRNARVSSEELDTYIKWFVSKGIIVIKNEWQTKSGSQEDAPVICLLNTGMIEEGF